MNKKVTEEQKLEIRELYATGDWSQRQLAKKYGVAYQTIDKYVEGIHKPEVTLQKRFDKKYREDENGCWVWIGSIDKGGYGRIGVDGKNRRAPRVSYQLYNGEIPEGQLVRHTCDNRACVNPEHLILGTALQNRQDMEERFRDNWPFPAITYLEMKAFHEVGVSSEWIEQHFDIKGGTLKNRLADMNKKATDPTKEDRVSHYLKRAINDSQQAHTV